MVDNVDGEKTGGGTPNPEDVKGKEGDNKHPETVPWSQYVGVKEQLGTAKEKVTSLEEQVKNAPNPEELKRIQGELDKAKEDLTKTTEELNGIKNQSVATKKAELVKRGVPEEKLKDASEKELDLLLDVGVVKHPKPDLGGGGGSGQLTGSPLSLARQAYESSNK